MKAADAALYAAKAAGKNRVAAPPPERLAAHGTGS
jgi:PleD family two-component response regulator